MDLGPSLRSAAARSRHSDQVDCFGHDRLRTGGAGRAAGAPRSPGCSGTGRQPACHSVGSELADLHRTRRFHQLAGRALPRFQRLHRRRQPSQHQHRDGACGGRSARSGRKRTHTRHQRRLRDAAAPARRLRESEGRLGQLHVGALLGGGIGGKITWTYGAANGARAWPSPRPTPTHWPRSGAANCRCGKPPRRR